MKFNDIDITHEAFIALTAEDQFNLLIDPGTHHEYLEEYFTSSKLTVVQLIQVLKVNARVRRGGNHSFRRMIYFILSRDYKDSVDSKELATHIVNSQIEYADQRRDAVKLFL